MAIVDVTGVQAVDTHVANMPMQAAQSVRRLGAEVVVTGTRAGAAQAPALPTGAVSAKAVAVRFERSRAGAGEFLVCVEITETEGAAAERWVSHVRRCVAAPDDGTA